MKKFADYINFVETRKKEIEEENKRWEAEEDKQAFFFSRNIIPVLEKMHQENSNFHYEYKGTKESAVSLLQDYDLIIDEGGLLEGRYELQVTLHLHEQNDNLVFKITNYHSDKEVEAYKNYEGMTPELVEHTLTELLMTLFERDQG